MYHVRVEAEFSAAHFVRDYQGKCEQLHGHNYRVRLWARGTGLDENGMLADFTVLKKALRTVCAVLDHTSLNDNSAFDGSPSAERIARHIFLETGKLLSPKEGAMIRAVDVFETRANMARYEPD
jgi:6-pyruvoyltetrahydropterin/6-carboxytetrahydropterin synthase